MKTFKLMVMWAGVTLGAVACEDAEPAAAPAPVTKPAKPKAAVEKPASTPAEPAYVYAYNPVGKRDPFRSPQPEGAGAVAVMPSGPCNEPLCQFDLEQLRLVAVVTGDANPVAMVEDPAGRGHIVRRNTRVGRQGGKVTGILRDSLTVTEYVPSGGKLIPNAVSIVLRPDDKMAPQLDLLTGNNWGQ